MSPPPPSYCKMKTSAQVQPNIFFFILASCVSDSFGIYIVFFFYWEQTFKIAVYFFKEWASKTLQDTGVQQLFKPKANSCLVLKDSHVILSFRLMTWIKMLCFLTFDGMVYNDDKSVENLNFSQRYRSMLSLRVRQTSEIQSKWYQAQHCIKIQSLLIWTEHKAILYLT